MYKLTLEQKISNLKEQREVLEKKAERLVKQIDGIDAKLQRLESKATSEKTSQSLNKTSVFES